MSTESIANPEQSFGVTETCRNCGSPLVGDQRYCLECGERRPGMSSVMLGGPPRAGTAPPPPAAGPPGDSQPRPYNSTLTVIAGVGVLLLAMGVGVLIGRSSGSKATQGAPQVITVGTSQGGTPTTAVSETFTGNWPAGKTGFTVQLQTLPQSGTTVAAVEAAKSAATAKGARNVGALKSEEFSSLPSGQYVIYSRVYRTRSEAQKALGRLKSSFPTAKVVEVSNKEAGSSSSEGPGASESKLSHGGVGNNLAKPAPPTVLESKPVKGQSYEQKSKNLPNVIETG